MAAQALAPTRTLVDLPEPPGGHWLLGHAAGVRQSSMHLLMEGWAREMGPLFRIRFAHRRLLVVADHALLAEALRQRPDVWQRNPATRQVGREMGLPQGVFSAEGEPWRVQRRMVMAAFAPDHIRAYFPQMAKVTARLAARWRPAAEAGTPLPLQPELMRYTVDTIAGLALGEDINTLQSGDDVIQQHLDLVLPNIMRRAMALVPYWRWFKRPQDRALDRAVATINHEIDRFIAQAHSQLQATPALRTQPANMLQAMLVAAESEGTLLTGRDVAGNVLTMLLAGEDTTANSLAWTIYLLHRHPAALEKARQEVLAALGSAAGDPERYTSAMMDSLPYLEACLHEAMRLKPVAPFISLQALKDTQLADVAVPAGTVLWGIFRHDSVREPYFERPQSFEPERWLGEMPGSAKRVAMPFGAGPRICPGRYLAMLEMKLAMSMLLSQFHLHSVSPPEDGEPGEEFYFTMGPTPLNLYLQVRA